MAKKTENTEAMTTTETFDPNEVLAHIIKDDDGNYYVKDLKTGETGPACKLCDANDKTIVLTKNSSNRKWANRAKADEAIAKDGYFPLCYKESKHFGPIGTKMPNDKLIQYLPEELQAEYKAIIDRAIAAREADKAKPMTDIEKAQAKIAKAQAALDKLLAQAAGTDKE